jgi:hypothetical protein
VLWGTHTQRAPQGACCQTLGFLITLYSVRDPGSTNPARQMQNSLAEAALTGAISMVLGNLRDRTNTGEWWSLVSVCPVHRMATEQQLTTEAA